MTPQELYQQKKKTVAEALSLVRSGDTIIGGTYVCEPLQLYRALHTIADRVRDVTVWLGITTENYPFCSDPAYEDAFFVNSFFYDAQARSNHRRGRISYAPFHLHQMPAGIAAQKPDIFMTAVPPMDKDGYFYLTPIQQIEAEMFQAVPTRILEVNPRSPSARRQHPSACGAAYLHLSPGFSGGTVSAGSGTAAVVGPHLRNFHAGERILAL